MPDYKLTTQSTERGLPTYSRTSYVSAINSEKGQECEQKPRTSNIGKPSRQISPCIGSKRSHHKREPSSGSRVAQNRSYCENRFQKVRDTVQIMNVDLKDYSRKLSRAQEDQKCIKVTHK